MEMGQFCVGSAQPKDEAEMEKYMKRSSINDIEVMFSRVFSSK